MAVPRTLEELNQHPVFSYFLWLCEIPHATFKEKALSNAIYTWAKRHEKWMSWQDTHHNLYIRKPATPGYEAKPALLFQAHLDMVCVAAPGVIHNFDKDPLTLALEGDRLTTGGRTTLGADDGIGVALAMALLDDETQAHPEIEVLFTTAEEEDFSGAAAADIDWFHAHQLINIDNARENHATTGSAGGYGIHYERPVIPEKPGKNLTYFKIGVGGMMGGHSGEDIHRGRGSAIRLLSRMLFAARRAIPIQLAGLTGGSSVWPLPAKQVPSSGFRPMLRMGSWPLWKPWKRPLRQNIRAPILGSFSPRPQSLRMKSKRSFPSRRPRPSSSS